MSDPRNKSILATSHSLLERVRDQSDEEAWKEFIDYYKQYIYNILRHIRIPEADAEEICQDIIVKLWKKMPEFVYSKDRGKFRNWLGVIIRNDANKYYNKNTKKENLIDSQKEELDQEADPRGSYDMDSIIADEWNNYISNLAWESIKRRFEETTQKVFLLHVEGKTAKEIAEISDIKEKTVQSCIHRIKIHLKDEINRFDDELL